MGALLGSVGVRRLLRAKGAVGVALVRASSWEHA